MTSPSHPPVEIDLTLDQSRLAVTFTSSRGLRNTIHLPKDGLGLAALCDILEARHRAIAEHRAPSIGTAGVPVQSLVNAFLASGRKIEDDAARAERQLRAKMGDELYDLAMDIGEMEDE